MKNENILTLTCKNTSASVNIANGMTVERIIYNGLDLIDCDEKRLQSGATYAVPILFPTPNRVKGGQFMFEGKTTNAIMHGNVRNAAFKLEHFAQTQEQCVAIAGVEITKESQLYSTFNYECKLTVKITVKENEITWDYTVLNGACTNLPFSFALHPFWKKYKGTKYRVNAKSVMEMDGEKIPSGNCDLIAGTDFDVSNWRTPEEKEFDDVFCTNDNLMAQIQHENDDLAINICTSDEFKKCVVYTPSGRDWFCIEPQTSSTDCHNLHANGFKDEANLQIVPPLSAATGKVSFKFAQV